MPANPAEAASLGETVPVDGVRAVIAHPVARSQRIDVTVPVWLGRYR